MNRTEINFTKRINDSNNVRQPPPPAQIPQNIPQYQRRPPPLQLEPEQENYPQNFSTNIFYRY